MEAGDELDRCDEGEWGDEHGRASLRVLHAEL